jgi:TPR repeat protein
MRRFCISGYTNGLESEPESEYSMSENNEMMDFASAMAAFEAKEFSRAMQLLSPYAKQGDAEAQHRLAIMYQNGLGVAQNDAEAVKWMRAAAEQGHALAQHGMGFMYLEGECVEKDPAEAAKWFTLAAEQGLAGSQTTLAMMYEEGNGVEQDAETARKWYAKAGF